MPPDFALIVHPDSWSTASAVMAALRGPQLPPIPMQDLREILPWIPPRPVSRINVASSQGHFAHGLYIDTFIPPDRLEAKFLRENLARVREAAQCAIREGARIVALGGFSSILLEGRTDLLPAHPGTYFTTGNTLTVALIVRGIERAVELSGRRLSEARVLVIGASGDVGSGCARCLAPRVRQLLLCARNPERLRRFASEFSESKNVEADCDMSRLAAKADVVICAASTTSPLELPSTLSADAIVCDAGYPKNVRPCEGGTTFFGGFGQACDIKLDPDLLGVIYPYPVVGVAHGCLLEAIALALEKRFEPFSQGRGRIVPERVDEIWQIAQRHGIGLPPLFNSEGLVKAPMELRA